MRQVLLSLKHYKELITAAESEFPRECCGLLIGHGTDRVTVNTLIVTENVADRPDRFLIDPQVQFDWMRRLRGQDQRIVGHFHSHPNGTTEPSEFDRSMALDTDLIWLIAQVVDGHAASVQAYEVITPREHLAPAALIVRD